MKVIPSRRSAGILKKTHFKDKEKYSRSKRGLFFSFHRIKQHENGEQLTPFAIQFFIIKNQRLT
jgi:hypothetical protein